MRLVSHAAEWRTSQVHIQKYSSAQNEISLCLLFCLEDPSHAFLLKTDLLLEMVEPEEEWAGEGRGTKHP